MAREHKVQQRTTKRYPAKSSQRTGSVKWVLFGLVLGFLVSLFGYWHFHGATNPEGSTHQPAHPLKKITPPPVVAHTPQFDFYTVLPKMQAGANMVTQPAQLQPSPVSQPTKPEAATEPASSTTNPAVVATQTADAQQKVLGIAPASTIDQPPAASAVATTKPTQNSTKPAPTDATSVHDNADNSAKTGHFVLQVASVKDYADADRYKAQLSMLGFDVNIQKYLFNGQTWYRVNIGPFASRQTALDQQQRLKENGVKSILVKQALKLPT